MGKQRGRRQKLARVRDENVTGMPLIDTSYRSMYKPGPLDEPVPDTATPRKFSRAMRPRAEYQEAILTGDPQAFVGRVVSDNKTFFIIERLNGDRAFVAGSRLKGYAIGAGFVVECLAAPQKDKNTWFVTMVLKTYKPADLAPELQAAE